MVNKKFKMVKKKRLLTLASPLYSSGILIILVFNFLFLIFYFPGAGADEVDRPVEDIDLKELITTAFKDNPGLKAAKMRWEAVIEKHPQVTSYEDPVLSYTHFIENVETRVGPQERIFSLSQKIPFPGKLTLKGDIVDKEVEIARTTFEKETRDLIAELKDAYYELLYISSAIHITSRNRELVEHLAKIGTADYAVDGTTLNDVFKAQSQLAQLSYDLILLTEFREAEVTRINSILNRRPELPLGKLKKIVYVPFTIDLDELYTSALNNQQELTISQFDIEKRGKAVSLAKMVYLPNFKLGVTYADVGAARSGSMAAIPDDSGKDAYAVNLGITIPLWIGKNRSRVVEAEKRRQEAVYRKKERENRTFAAIKTVWFKIRNSERLITLYKESLIPQAEQSMETAETWYKEKRGSFSGLLETQSVWLNFNLALHRAVTDYYQRIAKLEKLVGINLNRKFKTENLK